MLDFLRGRCQRIVRDVQRIFLDSRLDYAIHRYDCVGYLLLESRIAQFIDFDSSLHCFAQTRIGIFGFSLHTP